MTRLIPIKDGNQSRCATLDDSLSVLSQVSPGLLRPYGRTAWGWLFLILTSILLTSCPAPREPFSFYYDPLTGRQVPLVLDLDSVAIAPVSLQLDDLLQNILLDEPLLNGSIADGGGIFHFVAGLTDEVTEEEIWALLDRLNEREDVQWAGPYVHRDFLAAGLLPPPYTEGPEIILDVVRVDFSYLTPSGEIDALFERFAVEAEEFVIFPEGPPAYEVRATEETGLTTLDLANMLHAETLTRRAYPTFQTLYIF